MINFVLLNLKTVTVQPQEASEFCFELDKQIGAGFLSKQSCAIYFHMQQQIHDKTI